MERSKFTRYSEIRNKHTELGKKYPEIEAYESRASLWNQALHDGVINQEEFELARDYYGNLWTYVGD